jgi:hypothetical protein
MCEATLGTTHSSASSPSSSSNSKSNSDYSAPPPFHTNPTKSGSVKSKLGLGLGFGKTKTKSEKLEGAWQTGQEAEGYPESKLVSNPPSDSASKSHPTSPGALISQPSQTPTLPQPKQPKCSFDLSSSSRRHKEILDHLRRPPRVGFRDVADDRTCRQDGQEGGEEDQVGEFVAQWEARKLKLYRMFGWAHKLS